MKNIKLMNKLKEMQINQTPLFTAGGRRNLWIAEVDEEKYTIRFRRSTGKISWPLKISDIERVCGMVQRGEVELHYKDLKKVVPTFENYIVGLINHIGYK